MIALLLVLPVHVAQVAGIPRYLDMLPDDDLRMAGNAPELTAVTHSFQVRAVVEGDALLGQDLAPEQTGRVAATAEARGILDFCERL